MKLIFERWRARARLGGDVTPYTQSDAPCLNDSEGFGYHVTFASIEKSHPTVSTRDFM